jgi:hypothetical protein
MRIILSNTALTSIIEIIWDVTMKLTMSRLYDVKLKNVMKLPGELVQTWWYF